MIETTDSTKNTNPTRNGRQTILPGTNDATEKHNRIEQIAPAKAKPHFFLLRALIPPSMVMIAKTDVNNHPAIEHNQAKASPNPPAKEPLPAAKLPTTPMVARIRKSIEKITLRIAKIATVINIRPANLGLDVFFTSLSFGGGGTGGAPFFTLSGGGGGGGGRFDIDLPVSSQAVEAAGDCLLERSGFSVVHPFP